MIVNDFTWQSVYIDGKQENQNSVDTTGWIITIGDTSGYNFEVIVCDSETYEVIGYIPMQ